MKVKFCLPIIKNTKAAVLTALNTTGYDYYEIWLDYIEDLDKKFIQELITKFAGSKKMIFLFRKKNLEKIKTSIKGRMEILELLKKKKVLIDLDISQNTELYYIRKNDMNSQLILSYHNYLKTPTLTNLKIKIEEMKRNQPDIFKIATFCQKEEDSLTLLSLLLLLKSKHLKYIILGMGKIGLITRIIGLLWGNEINFAPQNLQEKSADGQLSKEQLELILQGAT